MGYLLYLIFRCDFNVMESLKSLEEFGEVNTAYIVFQHRAGLVATFASERCSNPVPLSSETSSNVLVLPAVYHAHTS